MNPKLMIQIGFVLVALLVFVVRAVWAAQQEREEDEMFRGKPGGDQDASRYRRADPNSAWEDQRQLAASEAERERESQRESLRDHSRGFSQRVSRDVDTRDVESKIDSEVHRKFDDRHVGTLDAGTPAATAGAAASAGAAGAGTSAVWSNEPERLRDAFIMREILIRPEQRWSETERR
jgi:hypothetical protein